MDASKSPYRSPVPRIFALTGAVVLAEPISATLLFPFVYFMVHDFSGVKEQEIGYWAGLITSAFFIPQMFTASIWGIFSDKYGRRPIMLVGLLGGAGCMCLFGFSKSLGWALTCRGLCGVFNGNAAVARTAVGEVAANARLNQGKAFSLFGFCSAVGYIVGPLVGGLLANPAQRFSLRGPGDIFVTYPYLFPCLFSGCYNLIVLVIAWFFLEETNQAAIVSTQQHSDDGAEEAREDDPLLAQPELESPGNFEIKKVSQWTSSTWCCLLGITCVAFHAIIFDEAYAVVAATKGPVGLGFTPGNIASSLSLMGPVLLIAQLFFFPLLNSRLTTLTLWRISAVTFVCVYPLFSLLPQMKTNGKSGSPALWAALLGLLAVRFMANVIAYTSIAILLNHVALPENRGVIMGLGQTAISLGRAVGPATGGVIWSWSLMNGLQAPLDSHFLFLILLGLAVAQGLSSLGIVKSAASTN